MVMVLAGSATLGVAAQAFVLFAFWRKAGLSYRPDFRWRGVGLARTGKAATWMFGMIVVAQLAGIVQANVASLAAGSDSPSLAILRFSWLVFMLPHSVVAVSLATAYFTRMSAHARDGKREALASDIEASLTRIGVFMVLACVGVITVAVPFARQFGTNHSAVTDMALVIMLYAVGLVPFSVLFVIQRVFYALEDTRTPFLLQVSQSLVFVALALVVATFSTGTIAFGLALSASIAGLVQTVLALVVMARKLGGFSFRSLLRSYLTFALAALPAALAGVSVLIAFGGATIEAAVTSSAPAAVGVGALITVAMVVVYFLTLMLLREGEVRNFVATLRARRASQ